MPPASLAISSDEIRVKWITEHFRQRAQSV